MHKHQHIHKVLVRLKEVRGGRSVPPLVLGINRSLWSTRVEFDVKFDVWIDSASSHETPQGASAAAQAGGPPVPVEVVPPVAQVINSLVSLSPQEHAQVYAAMNQPAPAIPATPHVQQLTSSLLVQESRWCYRGRVTMTLRQSSNTYTMLLGLGRMSGPLISSPHNPLSAVSPREIALKFDGQRRSAPWQEAVATGSPSSTLMTAGPAASLTRTCLGFLDTERSARALLGVDCLVTGREIAPALVTPGWAPTVDERGTVALACGLEVAWVVDLCGKPITGPVGLVRPQRVE
eukprot:2051439-Amphidinium_carterae.1